MSDRRRSGPARGSRALRPPVVAGSAPPADVGELLDRPVGLSGIGSVASLRRQARRLGIESVRDLLFHLPRRYDDLRELRRLRELRDLDDGTVASARVRVLDIGVQQTWRRRVQVTTAHLADETGFATATWFGRQFVEKRVRAGDELLVSGRIRQRQGGVVFEGPDFQAADASDLLHVGRIVPVYRLTSGITAKRLRAAMRAALDAAGSAYPEYLPAAIRHEEGLPGIEATLEAAHYPVTFEQRDEALRRLAFDELLALQLGMVGRRRARGRARTAAVTVAAPDDERIRGSVAGAIARRLGRATTLTDDQQRAIDEIRADLARESPMLRLVQGDVGSGKTAVAAWALAAAALDGRQAALLAPTDLLARQHRDTVGSLLEDLGIEVILLTGSLPAAARRHAVEALATGQARVVVGTHAMLQESVAFGDLALAVVDEQHRFGVEQRGALEAKATRGAPHVLLMTATPIPRTLGQVLYADLDVSTLRTPPSGRLAVGTGIRHPAELDELWAFVRREAEAGRRTFVVVPRIGPPGATDGGGGDAWSTLDELPDEDVETAWAAAAEAEHDRLSAMLAPHVVGLVHGRMKAADRDEVMGRFRDGDVMVLVGTTVVEVGVDIPAASVMVVEGADRFGLAQLHQLRGRVGRGEAQSYAALVSDAAPDTGTWKRLTSGELQPSTVEQARLVAVARTTDGFELAERDFELRREGDVLGLAQSGLPRLRVATLTSQAHRELATRTRAWAEQLLDDRGRLASQPELARELAAGWLRRVHDGDPASAA